MLPAPPCLPPSLLVHVGKQLHNPKSNKINVKKQYKQPQLPVVVSQRPRLLQMSTSVVPLIEVIPEICSPSEATVKAPVLGSPL